MQATPQPAPAPTKKSNTWKLIAIVVVILIVVGVAGYILTLPASKTANVIIQDDTGCSNNDTACLYNPSTYNATAGSTVIWRNDGGINHTVTNATATPDGTAFDSLAIGHNGGTYSHVFATKGTYHYYCTIHAWMKGTINIT